jgi:hypothetical protein
VTGADDQADAQWRWWRERRLPAERIHLDSAAAGRSSRATLAATAAHAEREATTGAGDGERFEPGHDEYEAGGDERGAWHIDSLVRGVGRLQEDRE